MKKKRRIKKGIIKSFILSIMGISFISLGISIYNIYTWEEDSKDIEEQVIEIEKIVEIEEIEDTPEVEIIEPVEEVDEFNPYWDYINMKLIDVNFEELKKINSSVAGWIKVNGTRINYPFVQTTDNDFYLTHSFNKSYNRGGWVFLDYENNKELSDKNNIIYAHGRDDNTMFGSLRRIFDNGWLDKTSNHVINISTEKENSLWQVFSVYHIPVTSDYLQVKFDTNEEFVTFGNMLLTRSMHDFKTSISENDIILTLSTCYSKTERMVLHAKLIKKETR